MLLSDAKHIAVTLFHLTYLRFSVVLRAQSVPLSISCGTEGFLLTAQDEISVYLVVGLFRLLLLRR